MSCARSRHSRTHGNDDATNWHTYETSGAARTVTVTNTNGNKYTSVGCGEFSGVDSGTAPLTNSNSGTGSPVTCGAIDSTSLGDGALYFAAMVVGNAGPGTSTLGTGFSVVYKNDSASNQPIATEYQIQPTAGALNAGWTYSNSGNGWAAVVSVFKASAGGGATPWIKFYLHHVAGIGA